MHGLKYFTVVLLIQLFILSPAFAAKIYKWTDEEGQIHYSAKKPVKNKSKSMYIHGSTQLQPENTANVVTGGCETITCRMNKYINDNPVTKRKKSDSSSNQSSGKIVSDTAIMAKCKKNRDVFCDQGADAIVRIDQEKAAAQREAAREAKMNPYIPRYKGNDIYLK